MIIVSQDKEFVINFDNVEYLQVVDNRIICSFVGGMATIGEYNTSARAREIMTGIHNTLYVSYLKCELPEV